jgi:Ser/Thr protein kinase RdoA (MazF antagonist)
MSATGRDFKRSYPPEVVLAEMLGKEFGDGTSPDPAQLKAWVIRHWGVLQSLAHEIHRQDQVARDASYTERYLAQLGQKPRRNTP